MISMIRRTLRHIVAPRPDTSLQRRLDALGLKLGDVPLSKAECERRGLLPKKEEPFPEELFQPRVHGRNSRESVSGRVVFRLD
jgi:hypothetical protein